MALSPKKTPAKANTSSDHSPSPTLRSTPIPQGRDMSSPPHLPKMSPPTHRGILEEVFPSFDPTFTRYSIPRQDHAQDQGRSGRCARCLLHHVPKSPLDLSFFAGIAGNDLVFYHRNLRGGHHSRGRVALLVFSRRMDLPLEVVQQLLLELDRSCGAEASRLQVTRWRQELFSPHSPLHFDMPCNRYGQMISTKMCDLYALSDIAAGVTCVQLGQVCLPRAGVSQTCPQATHLTDSYATAGILPRSRAHNR